MAFTMAACVGEFEIGEFEDDEFEGANEPGDEKPGGGEQDDVFKAANQALSASTSASSTYCSGSGLHCYHSYRINDGSRNTTVGGYYSWANDWGGGISLPQWVQLDFGGTIWFNRVDLYTSQGYAIRDYDIQYWNGSGWYNAATVNGNTSTYRKHTFSRRSASRIRVRGRSGPSNQTIYVRVNELEVYDECTPNTCQSWQCGYVSNGCGGTMYCGACDPCDPLPRTGEQSTEFDAEKAICPVSL